MGKHRRWKRQHRCAHCWMEGRETWVKGRDPGQWCDTCEDRWGKGMGLSGPWRPEPDVKPT